MFTLEVKTNRPWNLSRVDLMAGSWTKLPRNTFPSLKDVQVEISYIQQHFQKLSDVVEDLEIGFRISKDNEVLVEKSLKI